MTTAIPNNQGQLDAATAAISGGLAVIAELGVELQNLKAQEGASQLDFTALDAKVADLNAAVTMASVSAPVVDVSALQVGGNVTNQPAAPTSPDVPATDAGSATGGGQHAAPETDGTAPGKPLYKHVGTDPIDATAWPEAGLTATDDGAQLYTFSADAAGGQPTGASADWQVYTGPTSGRVEPTA